jgi:diadenosine tetraphosphate (Ap4A) HIT family hydrolase
LKLFESSSVFAFLDIQPLSKGHAVSPPSLTARPLQRPALPRVPQRKEPSSNVTQLVIPKHHGAKLTDIPDDQLHEILPVVKKIAAASGAENWNILQNNGRAAHQVVDHVRRLARALAKRLWYGGRGQADVLQVHFHMIPKPNEEEGLGIGWPARETNMDNLKQLHEQRKSKM